MQPVITQIRVWFAGVRVGFLLVDVWIGIGYGLLRPLNVVNNLCGTQIYMPQIGNLKCMLYFYALFISFSR